MLRGVKGFLGGDSAGGGEDGVMRLFASAALADTRPFSSNRRNSCNNRIWGTRAALELPSRVEQAGQYSIASGGTRWTDFSSSRSAGSVRLGSRMTSGGNRKRTQKRTSDPAWVGTTTSSAFPVKLSGAEQPRFRVARNPLRAPRTAQEPGGDGHRGAVQSRRSALTGSM